MENYSIEYKSSNALIVGSYFKQGLHWSNNIDEKCLKNFMDMVRRKCSCQSRQTLSVLVGSGITMENYSITYKSTNALIVGSYFKQGHHWSNNIDEKCLKIFMDMVRRDRRQKNFADHDKRGLSW